MSNRDSRAATRSALFGAHHKRDYDVPNVQGDSERARYTSRNMDMQAAQNDKDTSLIARKVSSVKHVSIEIRNLLTQQLDDIDDLDTSMANADTMLARTMNRLHDMIATGGSKNIRYLALFMVFVFFVLYALFQYYSGSA